MWYFVVCFFRILIECYIDDENRNKAIELVKNVDSFIRDLVPNMYNDFFEFAVKFLF